MKPYAGPYESSSVFNIIRSPSFIPKNLEDYHNKVSRINEYEISVKCRVNIFDTQILQVMGHQ